MENCESHGLCVRVDRDVILTNVLLNKAKCAKMRKLFNTESAKQLSKLVKYV